MDFKDFIRAKLDDAVKEGSALGAAALASSVGNAIGGQSRVGRDTSKSRAETSGERAGHAKKVRKNNPGQYLLNPAAPGPLSEMKNRIQRRHQASKSTHPGRSSLIPLYGAIRGGAAGKKRMDDQSKSLSMADKIKAYMAKHPTATKAVAVAAVGTAAYKVGKKIKGALANRKAKKLKQK